VGIDFGRLGLGLGGITDAIGQLIQEAEDTFTAVHTIVPRTRDIIAQVQSEVTAWSTFTHAFPDLFANRVINIESTRRRLRGILAGLAESWERIKDIGELLKEPTTTVGFVHSLESSRNPFVRGIGRTIRLLLVVRVYVEKVSAILDDLEQIINEAKAIRLAVENVEAIFLKQSNPRQRVQLANGNTIRIRVGSLHTGEL